MRIYTLNRTLQELSRQARSRQLTRITSDADQIAELAEQLRTVLDRGMMRKSVFSEDTISSAPSGNACACCGK
jgi:hypothetical protein